MNGRLRHSYEVERLGMEPDVPAALVPFGRRVNLNVNRVLRNGIPRSSDEAAHYTFNVAVPRIKEFLDRVANPGEFLASRTMRKWMTRLDIRVGLAYGGNALPCNVSEFDSAVANLQNSIKAGKPTKKAKPLIKLSGKMMTIPIEPKQEISQPDNIIEIPAPKPRKARVKKEAAIVDDALEGRR